jgi:hypothetical protein
LPARSVARTSKACIPSARAEYACGLAQPAQSPPSRRHSKLASASEPKARLASATFVRDGGPESMVVSGASVSIVQEWPAGPASTLPAASRARTASS